MDSLPPLHAPIRTLWAPTVIYEAGNPRQRKPLPLYDASARRPQTKQELRRAEEEQAHYAARRDVVNVLRGTTTRMVWDYQAEAATLSDDEQEYEAQLERIRTHGFSWMVPEGKQMNQEAEADDDAINEEARVTAAAAAAQAQRDADASNVGPTLEDIDEPAAPPPRRRQNSRRSRGSRTRRRSGTNGDAREARTRPRSSTASGSGLPPNSRDRPSQAPPRASTGRYSISSSNGGNASSVPLPRYGGASASSTMSRTRTSNEHGHDAGEERDLDADIPDADEDHYGNDESNDPADAVQHLDEDDDIFTDQGEEGSETNEYATSERRARRQESYYSPGSGASEGEENENRENEDSTDMDVSS